MDCVFLDANVLFSAAYEARCRIANLWQLSETQLIVSRYVAQEAIRNMEAKHRAGLKALAQLLNQCAWADEADLKIIPAGVELAEKDRPVLAAAIAGKANYLLTGDKHFRPLYGRVIESVAIMRPGDYLNLRGA
jgi:uncharacterized protein